VPTLVLRAGWSPVVSAEAAEMMGALNDRIRVVDYPNARPWLHQNEPQRFARDVLAFLGP
jgi:pimeloyl-ACP methyl ester carboxylesterase